MFHHNWHYHNDYDTETAHLKHWECQIRGLTLYLRYMRGSDFNQSNEILRQYELIILYPNQHPTLVPSDQHALGMYWYVTDDETARLDLERYADALINALQEAAPTIWHTPTQATTGAVTTTIDRQDNTRPREFQIVHRWPDGHSLTQTWWRDNLDVCRTHQTAALLDLIEAVKA